MRKRNRMPPSEHDKQCAARAKALYKSSKMTQSEIGDKMGGMSASAVAQYLNGAISMGLPTKLQLAEVFGVHIQDIDPSIKLNPPLTKEEEELLAAFRDADDEGRKLTIGVALAASRPKSTL